MLSVVHQEGFYTSPFDTSKVTAGQACSVHLTDLQTTQLPLPIKDSAGLRPHLLNAYLRQQQ